MLFNSTVFLFLFLPVTLLIYYLSPKSVKNLILVIASLIFYTWGEAHALIILLASIAIDFSAGIIIDKGHKKTGLAMALIGDLSLLLYFKYFNFAMDNFHSVLNYFNYTGDFFHQLPHIVLPIGISFYTFQTLSYVIDVYRGDVKASRNIISFAAFVTMFPQLIAGPIVRYIDIEEQLRNKDLSVKNFSSGIERFIIGLAKKTLIANSCAYIADNIFAQPISEISTLHAWAGIIAYAFQIYFDFSGYSDMAIGLGRMFGFDFLENFNYPYISRNIREFWRRWHISLSTWFRDYLYIPLGGSKDGKFRTYLNLVIVFFITGLWHGANWTFIVWGLFHGLFLIIERLGFNKVLQRLWKPLQHIYTLLVILVGWVFFRSDNIHNAFAYLGKMFSFTSGERTLASYINLYNFTRETIIIFLLAAILSTPVFTYFYQALLRGRHGVRVQKVALYRPFLFIIFVVSVAYIAAGAYSPFIYFRF
jgi:alginate O-acetyltransferase complex protein AlgI